MAESGFETLILGRTPRKVPSQAIPFYGSEVFAGYRSLWITCGMVCANSFPGENNAS